MRNGLRQRGTITESMKYAKFSRCREPVRINPSHARTGTFATDRVITNDRIFHGVPQETHKVSLSHLIPFELFS
jgi:hypothetical protein